MIVAAIMFATASGTSGAWHPQPPEVASAWLGASGATLLVRSVDDRWRRGTAHRRLTLSLPSGKRRSTALHDGGGAAENQALDLYHAGQERFLLVSERDCVDIDAANGRLTQCQKPAACSIHRTYLGRFDWMNGYDPPKGHFGLRWRFLPAYDALENGGC